MAEAKTLHSPLVTCFDGLSCGTLPSLAFEAALQLLLPGKTVEGPISPEGNRPVNKGVELYLRIGKNLGIKVFTNCKFGMMACAILALTYCIKQYEQNGEVADSLLIHTILVLVHIKKCFSWEDGYMSAMDIAHDRGLSILLASPGMYLVNHPVNLGIQALSAYYISLTIVTGKSKTFAELMANV
ncbi:hypothetical protein NC651_025879 [Populus alba x Populus x berolinensis]|nr:hypothetical protein NC651_025879 [Populus alba x Populus x berolinensis]